MEEIKKVILKEFWEQNWNVSRLSQFANTYRQTTDNFLFNGGDMKLGAVCRICKEMGLELVIRKREE